MDQDMINDNDPSRIACYAKINVPMDLPLEAILIIVVAWWVLSCLRVTVQDPRDKEAPRV